MHHQDPFSFELGVLSVFGTKLWCLTMFLGDRLADHQNLVGLQAARLTHKEPSEAFVAMVS